MRAISAGGDRKVAGGISRRAALQAGAGLLAGLALWPSRAAAAVTLPPDFDVPNGHHYAQASGIPAAGYEVRNTGGIDWWDGFRRLGGTDTLGYPVSRPYGSGGFAFQAFQNGLLHWSEAARTLQPANVLETLDAAGLSDWLLNFKSVPLPLSDDSAATFDQAVRIRLEWLADDAIRATYEGNPDPVRYPTWTPEDALTRWGLPMSRPQRRGPFVVQRFQRAVLQHWVEAVEGMPAPGTVTRAAVGDMLLEAGLIPAEGRTPVDSQVALDAARGGTVGERLRAAIAARLRAEPGRWAVLLSLLGAPEPLVALRADAEMPAASLWKVAAMLEAFRQRALGELSFDHLLTMNASVLERVDPPASLAPGQRISVRTALEQMISVSDNTVAILLADRLRYARIDQTLVELGLTQTTVSTREPVTSARDMALLLEVAVGGRSATWPRSVADLREMRALLFSETRNNRLPALLPPGTPVAHKTGDLGTAVHDAGVIYGSTGPFVLVVLEDGAPDPERSAATSADLARMVFGALDPQSGPASEMPAG